MPGIKRKAATTSSASPQKRTPNKKPAPVAQHGDSDSDNNDDFDDDEDLLASAAAGTGSAAIPDDEEDDSDSNDDQETAEDGDNENADNAELMSDEDMEGGFEDLEAEASDEQDQESEQEQDPQSSSGAPKKKSKPAALYALPTTEEVKGLKETGELFKSNVFKLKIDEMLPEVRPAYTKAGALELALRRLHTTFEGIKPIEPSSIPDALKKLEKRSKGSIKVPFPDPAPKDGAQYKLAFEKPAGMHLVGSWPLKSAAIKPDGVDVDVAVVMPSSLFQEKDHMNFRYFHKRAFYLAVLAHAISSASNLGVSPSFQLMEGDPRRSVLILKPVHNKSDTDYTKLKASIRIHLAHEPGLFNFGRLGPLRNSVRVGPSSAEASEGDKEPVPTPRYNAAVLMDGLQLAHLVYLHTTAQACPAFADACLLLKTWAFQRGFGSGARTNRSGAERRQVAGSGSLRFVLTMVLAHLLNGEEKVAGRAARSKLANGFSSYQLFRGVIDWLATHDFQERPVFMKPMPSAGLVSRRDKIPRSDFSQAFERVFVDPSGCINLFSFLPTGSLDLLQAEAKKTLGMLNDTAADHFEALFLQDRTAPVFTYDEVAHLYLPSPSSLKGEDAAAQLRRADFGNLYQANLIQVSATASRALRGRATLVALSHPASGGLLDSWPLDAARPHSLAQAELGVMLNGETAWRMVEHGPRSDETEAAEEFRSFWGELAELRRFKDGRILESVVWPVPDTAARWAIPRRILAYALNRHHGMADDKISFLANKFDGLLDIDAKLARRAYLVNTDEKGFQLVQSAYDGLVKDLRAMDGLPLSIITIAPCSSGLRGTSAFVPGPLNLEGLGTRVPDVASYLPAHEIAITFESSGKWPDEVEALQAIKAAFCEAISHEIATKIEGSQCRVVLSGTSNPLEDQVLLELILPSGFAFHIRVHHERERALLEHIVTDRFETGLRKKRAKAALQVWERRFVVAPRHHLLIANVGHKFASFGGAVRLVKRWISSRMLGEHMIAEELIELVAAAAFLSPEEGAPASQVAGFLRIMRLLATWRWKEEPLAVPVQTAADAAEDATRFALPTGSRTEVENSFQAARGADPSMATRTWFVATEADPHGLDFGRECPFPGAAMGIKKMAKEAVALLEKGGAELSKSDIQVSSEWRHVQEYLTDWIFAFLHFCICRRCLYLVRRTLTTLSCTSTPRCCRGMHRMRTRTRACGLRVETRRASLRMRRMGRSSQCWARRHDLALMRRRRLSLRCSLCTRTHSSCSTTLWAAR